MVFTLHLSSLDAKEYKNRASTSQSTLLALLFMFHAVSKSQKRSQKEILPLLLVVYSEFQPLVAVKPTVAFLPFPSSPFNTTRKSGHPVRICGHADMPPSSRPSRHS